MSGKSAFYESLQLPIHRWYRFPAGFSASWVKETILNLKDGNVFTVLDPFVGCGTTVLAGEESGVQALGLDAHPFIVRMAKAKLTWRENVADFIDIAYETLKLAKGASSENLDYPELIHKCYSDENLQKLDKLKRAWLSLDDESSQSELTWLALVCILRSTSHAGTAPWQYIQPKKKKTNVVDPFFAFENQIGMMIADIQHYKSLYSAHPQGLIFRDDARECSIIENESVDLVITSPPYTNNYDYADATRLEMTFFKEIQKWSDLQEKIRRFLIRSCSQHMRSTQHLDKLLHDEKLDPIKKELHKACYALEKEREFRSTKKKYHLMVAAYFSDLARVWCALRRVCKENSLVCFVIGDSAPYGVHIPVEKWLGELAISSGFKSYRFEKTRNRNIKWRNNRKNKVSLHEGRLWVKG